MQDSPQLIAALLRHPSLRLPAYLAAPHAWGPLLLRVVLPLGAIRPLATLLRGAASQAWTAGIVLAVSHWLLHLAVFAALGLLLPWVLRPFGVAVPRRLALALAALLCAPTWLCGVLFVVPEELQAALLVSRVAALALGAYGLLLLWWALPLLAAPPPARRPIVAAVAATFAAVYAGAFVAVGIAANVVLALLGSDA